MVAVVIRRETVAVVINVRGNYESPIGMISNCIKDTSRGENGKGFNVLIIEFPIVQGTFCTIFNCNNHFQPWLAWLSGFNASL